MDCILQREDTLSEFLAAWKNHSLAIVKFAESHKPTKDLKHCFRDASTDPQEDSETEGNTCTTCMFILNKLRISFYRLTHCFEMSCLFYD